MGLESVHVRDELVRLAEHRLAPDERRRVEAHLADCADCQVYAIDVLHIVDGLRALPGALSRLPEHSRYRAAQGWPAVWARVGSSLALGRSRLPLAHVSLYVSLVSAFFVFVMARPTIRGPVQVTANLAQTPLVALASTAAYRQEPAVAYGSAAALRASAATSAGTVAIQPIPIPTPVPGPGG